MARKLTPITPGEILLQELIKPLGISQSRLARDLSVPVRRVNDIVQGNAQSDLIQRCGSQFISI
jgi:addiction module HigA family antidote